MCTVVGYIGKNRCSSYIFEGLTRLEYRGYDSAGFACLTENNQKLFCLKASGQLGNLTERFQQEPTDGFSGVGHTRWSTHGDFSEKNAHPHIDCTGTIAVVHNGIIENYRELKEQLIREGHMFLSDTDSEVIPHLLEKFLIHNHSLKDAALKVVAMLDGMYAFVTMLQNVSDTLLIVRKRSPLCVGIGDGEMFVASDSLAFAGKTNTALFLPDESFALVRKNNIELYDFLGNILPIQSKNITYSFIHEGKDGHEHFMLKEIYQQKTAIGKTVTSLRDVGDTLWNQLGVTAEQMQQLQHICFVACGTSWHSARIAQFFFESITNIPVSVYLASEFRYMPFFPQKNTLYVIISQSGETADALEGLRLINSFGLPTIALTNVATSTMVREATGFLLTQAGPEVSVASTKAFTTQLAALYWLSKRVALEKGLINPHDMAIAEQELCDVARILEATIDQYRNDVDTILAPQYAKHDKAIFLGRNSSYPLAMEAALKLKELAYVFAQSYPAGELKHGPLALVDNQVPVYIFSHQDPLIYQKLVSNAHEVKARGGNICAFAYEGQDELCSLAVDSFIISGFVPPLLGPLAMAGIMQYFVYAIAKERGCPIDKPRNLAKSVTVE